jgi:hypothetical protein
MIVVKKIKTKLGYIIGRDAIYLDFVKYSVDEVKLVFEGQISGDLCSVSQSEEWIEYQLIFECVNQFKCTPIDDFDENRTLSSFDEVANNLNIDSTDYILSTYDHIYEINAKSYKLIGGSS